MRTPVIVGLALILAGGFFLLRGGSFTSRDEVLTVGDLKVTAERTHPIQPWIAGLVIVTGVVFIATGIRSKA